MPLAQVPSVLQQASPAVLMAAVQQHRHQQLGVPYSAASARPAAHLAHPLPLAVLLSAPQQQQLQHLVHQQQHQHQHLRLGHQRRLLLPLGRLPLPQLLVLQHLLQLSAHPQLHQRPRLGRWGQHLPLAAVRLHLHSVPVQQHLAAVPQLCPLAATQQHSQLLLALVVPSVGRRHPAQGLVQPLVRPQAQ
jgi:hypothetical protein